jgi:predicted aspartyl protease
MVKLENKDLEVKFLVSDAIQHDLILGMDTLEKCGMRINCRLLIRK